MLVCMEVATTEAMFHSFMCHGPTSVSLLDVSMFAGHQSHFLQ